MRISFDQVIVLLKEYKSEFGNLLVPQRYCTVTGVKLGEIVYNITTGNWKITPEEKAKLDEIGFILRIDKEISFNEAIKLLEAYKRKYRDLKVPYNYCTVTGVRLGHIVYNIRTGNRKITPEEKAKLDEIGFVWENYNRVCQKLSFDEIVELLEEYKKEFGDLAIPIKYTTVDGIKLGNFVSNIRSGVRKITVEEKAKLDEIGFVWKARTITQHKVSFDEVIKLLKEYKREYGDLHVPNNYCTVTGVKLGNIVKNIRSGYRKITEDERTKLNEIGFVWKDRMLLSFDEILELLKEYKREHGDLLVPYNYRTADGIRLGNMVRNIRSGYRKITLREEKRLNEIGFVWRCRNLVCSFDEVLELLKEYKRTYGNVCVKYNYCTEDGIRLGDIVYNIKSGDRKITEEEREKLNELGFVWRVK